MIFDSILEFQFLFMLLLSGLLAGFVASTPPGPVNLWIVNAILKNENESARSFTFGVILADLIYIGISFILYFFFFSDADLHIDRFWTILSGLLIACIGMYSLLSNNRKIVRDGGKIGYSQKISAFLTGIMICGSNMMLLIFWLFIAGVLDNYGLKITNTGELLVFLLGTLLGDLLWFFPFIILVKKGAASFHPESLVRFQKIIAISIILFGLITACK